MKNKIRFSFLGSLSDKEEFSFYDNSNFEWVSLLENNWLDIKEETDAYIKNNERNISPYFNQTLVTKKNSWKSFAFFLWGWKVNKNIKECPKTNVLLSKIPGIVSASISILESNTEIKKHRGDTNAIVRAHLGLSIPEGLPSCGFEVEGEKVAWKNGGVLVFNDAAYHSAWNLTDKKRYVLLIDVMKEEFIDKQHYVCSTVLSKLILQSFLTRYPFLKKVSKKIIWNNVLKFNAVFIKLLLKFFR